MNISDKRMYVYCAVGGIAGVSAEPGDAGAILWQLPWNAKVVAPSPVALEDGRIFLTAGYGEGGMMIQVRETNGIFSAEVLYKHGPKDGLACEQQTPIYHDGLLYGIMPKDAGALRGQFVCYRPDGSLAWSSGQSNRFGFGPFLLVDGKFYLLDDDGTLTMIRASRASYEPLGQARVLHGQDAWGPMALAGDRMLLRDSKQMICLAMGAQN
jgi:outer membrane protein assembly factor BamB